MSKTTFDPNAASSGDSGIFGLPDTEKTARLILLGVPWDVTTSYRAGASRGPEHILEASRQVDLFDLEYAISWAEGIWMKPVDRALLKKNKAARPQAEIVFKDPASRTPKASAARKKVNAGSEELNKWVLDESRRVLNAGKLLGVIGGDHSVPFGALRALAEKEKEFGVLHFDAHCDLRQAFEGFQHSHASIMHNVLENIPQVTQLTQVGIRDCCAEEWAYVQEHKKRIRVFFDADLTRAQLRGQNFAALTEHILATLPEKVYVSFDIDGLSPDLCPATGTPVPGGLSFQQAAFILHELSRTKKIIGFDLCEVAPYPKGSALEDDEWNGNVGARLLYKLCLATMKTNGVLKSNLKT